MYWDFDAEGKPSLVSLELYNGFTAQPFSLCVLGRNSSNTEGYYSFFQHDYETFIMAAQHTAQI